MTEKFKKQLEDLININCIDTLCDKPDYELAEMVCNFLSKLKSEWVVIGWEDHKNYIDFEEYMKLKRENEKLKEKLSKREQWEYRYFWNDGEQDIYEITSIKDWPITYTKDSTWRWVADWEPPYVLC